MDTFEFADCVEVSGIVGKISHETKWSGRVYTVELEQTLDDDTRRIPIRMYGRFGSEFESQAPEGTCVEIVGHLSAFYYERGDRWLVNVVCDPSTSADDRYSRLPDGTFGDRSSGAGDAGAEPGDIPF